MNEYPQKNADETKPFCVAVQPNDSAIGTMATDMFTLSRLHNTNATNKENTIAHRFFCPPAVMSNTSSSGGSFGLISVAPPPARVVTASRKPLFSLVVVIVIPTSVARVAFTTYDDARPRLRIVPFSRVTAFDARRARASPPIRAAAEIVRIVDVDVEHPPVIPLVAFSNYRPQFFLRTADITGNITLPEGTEMVMPGDNITAVFELIAPVAMDPGLRFALREGGRTVGAGVVSKVLD